MSDFDLDRHVAELETDGYTRRAGPAPDSR